MSKPQEIKEPGNTPTVNQPVPTGGHTGSSVTYEIPYIDVNGFQRLAVQPVIHTRDNEVPARSELSVKSRYHNNHDGTNKSSAEGQHVGFAGIDESYLIAEYGYVVARKTNWFTSKYTGCQISGLFYMGPMVSGVGTDGAPVYEYYRTVDAIIKYWKERARQQYGWHVFCHPMGAVCLTACRLFPQSVDKKKNWSNAAPIAALYPTVRFQREMVSQRVPHTYNDRAWIETVPNPYSPHLPPNVNSYRGWYWLTLGLVYAGPPDNTPAKYNRGDRYYVRNGIYQDSRKWGDVWEMTDPLMDTQLDHLAKPADGQRWALYVCAGAKLAVFDSYSTLGAKLDHNRVLVQQGGVVAGRGQLVFGAPIHHNELEHHSLTHTKTKVKGARHWFTDLSPNMQTKLAAIKNPVVFLAPLESEYGSIAWNLDIYHPVLSQERKCVLGIPEGGWFVAIEDWDAGIAEIKARHLYERLYESNVRMGPRVVYQWVNHNEFKAPDEPLAQTIVGIDADQRLIKTDILSAYPMFTDNAVRAADAVERTPLPVIYRCRQITEWEFGTVIEKGKYSGKTKANKPPVPADWPLVQYTKNGPKVCRTSGALGFLANDFKSTIDKLWPIEAKCLYSVPTTGANWPDDCVQYKWEGSDTYAIYAHNKRCDHKTADPYGGGLNSYMGIDGWVYNCDTDRTLGTCKTDYYAPHTRPQTGSPVRPKQSVPAEQNTSTK